ncbi:diguanylate cyclase [Bacillus sp. FJAT-27231]|uniref:diguanylate cyclase n=1 Tax=Bacillus sp. FJAT-27231 TaxID=1679168 RepID=UPI0006716466|nr:diguanylate cyclase [Bacillus sp. FJAT-27231]
MKKYQQIFLKKMDTTFQIWKSQPFVTEKELYRFLHSLKGTAGSIGLEELADIAAVKLKQLDEDREKQWSADEWKFFMAELIGNHNVIEQEELIETESEKKPGSEIVLLIESDIERLTVLRKEMEKKGWGVLAAMTADKGLSIFLAKHPDLLVIDLDLPKNSGMELLERIKETAGNRLTPIIAISRAKEKEMRMKAYEAGVLDYIEMPTDLDEILMRIQNKMNYRDLMREVVLIDELTGAFNRKFFNVEVKRQLQLLKESSVSFSLAIMDLDHFKKINDTYGHTAGDEVLKEFSFIVRNRIHQDDFFIRFGGEEFVLLMPECSGEQAKNIIQSIINEFKQQEFVFEDQTVSCSFSAGVVEANYSEERPGELLKKADLALYSSKINGRGKVTYYQDMNPSAEKEKWLRIGIIDDDAVMRQILEDQLRRMSFGNYRTEVRSFREGEAFFKDDWYKQGGKYIILLDGVMPRMDGIEVLQRLRNEFREEDFVIIMLTGRKSEKDVVKGLELGADDYLTKPFSIKELEARVRRLAMRIDH